MRCNIFSSKLFLLSLSLFGSQHNLYALAHLNTYSKRIAGGLPVPATIAKHAVRISFSNDNTNRICSGSLISDSHIVTAAHCVVDSNFAARAPSDIVIGYGNVDVNQQSKAKGVNIHLHPNFVQNGAPSSTNNIAIIEIAPLKLTGSVNRIPIYDKKIEPEQAMFTTGWGITAAGAENSSVLRGVAVVAGSKDMCVAKDKDFVSNDGPLICIPNSLTPGRSSCSNDGGGGILVSSDKFTMLAGFNDYVLTSPRQDSCGSADAMRFATHVSYFMDFIASVTGKQKEYFTSINGINTNSPTLPTSTAASSTAASSTAASSTAASLAATSSSSPSVNPYKTTTVTVVTVITRTV